MSAVPCRWRQLGGLTYPVMADSGPPETPGSSSLPPGFRGPEPSPSGWERVRELYRRNERGEYSPEVEFMVKSALTGATIGMVYGGVPAARFSREQYIKHSQAEVYSHRIEALRSVHNAAIRGFLRYGFRWGWRVAAFVSIFNFTNASLAAYRDKVVVSNFAAAGAVTGGIFRLNLGLRGLIGGSVIGALLGIPAGALISGLQTLTGEDLGELKQQERQRLRDLQLQERAERVAFTDVVVQEIQEAGEEPTEREVEKINQFLQMSRTAATEQ
ncbi:complex I assembly factor TIMMDC1, mitochondrial [Phyllobates terribilis]|uniref:complex I assembly factor TIMMDC1, mitochondrial n=1 Tax=Phyllobates terribilis TaxID=111132 RepID=UPI003CCAAAFE